MKKVVNVKKHRKIDVKILCVYVILTLYTLYTLYPIFLMIITSMKANLEIMKNPTGLPQTFSFQGYFTLFQKENFARYFANSAFVTIVSSLILLVVSILLAYALSRYLSRMSTFLYFFFLAGMMIPLRLGLLSLNDLLNSMGLIDNLWGLVFIYVAQNIPFTMFLLTGFIKMIPTSMEEVAYIDGANTWQVLWKVIVPLIKPAIATTVVYNFIPIWNDVFFPLIFISSKQNRTLIQAVTLFFGQYATNWNLVFAALTVACVPVIVVYIFCSKYLIKGMMAGALKG
ncbi:MAG TPA: carbohydrate ABC transporter permease [Candidatus Limiplasma sp.]|nr:carbohydrate ABC transporter permease [Candidatus Limiplasma sp.]